MTAFRRLISIACLTFAPMVLAQESPQTTKEMQTTTSTESQASRVTQPVTADTDKDLTDPRALKLSLDDAIHTSMRQNLGVDIQKYDYLMSGEILVGSWGVFDPIANATLTKSNAKSPQTNLFASTSSGSTVADLGLQGLLPTGATYNITSTNDRATSTGGTTLLNPRYDAGLGLALRQPLARNFGIDVNRRNIYIARNTLGINQELFRGALLDTTNNVEQAYDDLIYTRQYVDVVKEALFLARDQARITQIRIDVGASAPLDILQPRVQIATEDQALIAAVAAVRDAEDQLRAVMHLEPGDWDRPLIPTTPAEYTPITVDAEQAVTQALQMRPEMHEQLLTTANREIAYIYARNQALPQVDLNLNYSAAGVAGTTIDPVTGMVVNSTGYNSALSQVFGRDFPSYTFGVRVGLPILNIGARAAAKQAEYDVQLSKVTEEQTRQNIALNVRSAVRAIDTAAKEITASKTAREAAEQNVEAERRRYENGLSTNFQVLQIQQQLTQARASEIQALVAYNSAVAAYHRAIGDLLDVASIKIEEPQVNEPEIFGHFMNRYNWLNYGSHVQQPQTQP